MKNISLLPAEYKQKQRSQKRIQLYLLATVIILVLFAVSFIYMYTGNSKLENELAALQEKNTGLQNQIASLKPFQEAQLKINAIGDLVKQAAGSNPDWVQLTNQISMAKPQNVWMTEINYTYSGDTGTLKLLGTTADNSGIAEFVDNLRNVKGLKDVACNKFGLDDGNSIGLISFEIGASILQGEPWSMPMKGETNP